MRKNRSEPRVPFNTPVRVFGLDAAGKPVNATASTVDISRRGARIVGINNWQTPGEIVGLRYGTDKARYQIVWIGSRDTSQQGEMGLMCVEIGKVIWGAALPEASAAAAGAEAPSVVPARILGPAPGTAPGGRDAITGGIFQVRASSPEMGRRYAPRYEVEGGAHVRQISAQAGQWATLHDISAGGCYIETTSPFPVDSRIEAALQVGDVQLQVRGVVANVDPMTGMGIKFTDLVPTQRARLELLMATLAQAKKF